MKKQRSAAIRSLSLSLSRNHSMTCQTPKTILLFAALLLAAPTVNAVGQFKDVPPKYEEFGIVCLLGFPSVVEHLEADHELAGDNVKALEELGKNRLKNMHLRRDFRKKTGRMKDAQFTKARTELFETIQKSNSDSWAKAKKMLTEKQIARLEQLRIQRLGPAALMDSKVIQTLGLEEKQLEEHLKSAMAAKKSHDAALVKLKADLLESRRGRRISPQSDKDFEWNRNFAKKLTDAKISERDKVFDAVLDDQQKHRLAALTGAPFLFKLDFDFPAIKVDWQTSPLK